MCQKMEKEELFQKYSSLQELYEKVLKEKQDALEETERATISFARHFDSEVSSLTNQIHALTEERDKALVEAEDVGIKLANTKYELNRLQQEYIKLQLEQEKYLVKIESSSENLKKEDKSDLNEKGGIEDKKMEVKKDKEESLNRQGQLNHLPRPPVKIKKSKVDEDYTIYEELGRGKFGVVKRVVKQGTQEEFAAKWVKVTSQSKDDVLKEIEIMGKLNHRRLVGLYDAYEVSRNFVLIMEFITGGELFERIANEETVTEKECAYYMRQLLEGLQYMHKLRIVHLDLKPENIVCVSKDSWDIKLIDFGLAKELKQGKSIKTMQGTPEFVAPEVINFEPVCLASDMWSVGVIAYILISGLSPFLGDDDNETLSYVTAAEYDFDDEAFNEISHEAKDFIEKLLQKPPSKRKTADECLKHEWIKKNRGSKKIKTDNLKKFLAKRRWQKSVNAVRAVRRLSSMSSLFNAGTKAKSKSVAKLDENAGAVETPLATKRDFSKSMPSVFLAEGGQLNKRAIKILDSDTEASLSESGSVEQMNTADVDDKDVLEGLFKENKEILDFLSSGLANSGPNQTPTRSQEKLGGISEETDTNDDEQAAKPDFVEPLLETYTVPKGTPVLMTCTVRGSPAPTITWFRHDKALSDEDTDVTIERERNEYSLSIGQCEVQDEGSYACMAQNQFGQVTCTTKLDVQVSPDFVREMRDASVEERKRVQFDVQISGRPLPTVEWYHHETLLQEDRWIKIRKSTTDNTYSLVIRSATPERRGTYRCVITNPLDTISCSARLHIQGYDDEEEEENEEVLEEKVENELEDEVGNRDEHPRVSLRQDDINLYYDIKEEIGRGRFGVIYYAIHKATGRDYAVKYIKVRKSQRDQFQHEIDIMNDLRHRRYIRLYEAFEESRRLILVLELMRGGELLQRLAETDFLTENDITRYVKQILEGVKDMHEKDILHLDLKPQNIMFTSEESNNLKLIDFGLARKLNAEKDMKILFGTPEFVAPEVVNYEVITPATDMWSVGIITYILLSGVSPFWSDDPDITLANVTRAVWKMPEELFQGVSEDAKDFLTKLLVKDSSKRIKVDEAFQHPWIKAAKHEETNANHISTERLKKYYAHQKGLISASVVTSAAVKNEEKTKLPAAEEAKTKPEVNNNSNENKNNNNINNNNNNKETSNNNNDSYKGLSSSLVSELTKERDELKQQLEELLEKYNNMEEELRTVKTEKKEQEDALKKLQKRNKLLEDRNIANQEATQRLIRLECEKRDLEDKFQQKDKKFNDLSKKYENIREKAVSYDVLEEKVLYLEKERKTSQTQCKKVEEELKLLQETHAALKSKDFVEPRASIAEEHENEVFKDEKDSKNSSNELQNKVEFLSKELETAQAEVQKLNATITSQLEDLEEMERVEEHKRKLEARCKGLEEQLVELEHEGIQREHEIDEMEEDILDLQEKLEKSHKGLRAVLEENKALKKRLEGGERTHGRIRDISEHNETTKMFNSDDGSSGVCRKGKSEETKKSGKTRDISEQNGHEEVIKDDSRTSQVKSRKRSAEPLDAERKTDYVTKTSEKNGMTNGSEILSDDDKVEDAELFEEDGAFSAKYYQLEKEIQELWTEKFGEASNRNDGEENSEFTNRDPLIYVHETRSKFSRLQNMDVKQLRQLSRKLMKANKSLILVNEKLYNDKKEIEHQNELLRNEFGQKLQTLERENETFKRLLRAEDSLNSMEETLSRTTIEALNTELASQGGLISELKEATNKENKTSNIPECPEDENQQSEIQRQLELKIKTMKEDKSLMVFRYENELEESQNFYMEEQKKLRNYYEERIASVEKQNQNLKSQINALMSFNDSKKDNCDEHVKQLNDLKHLHQEELQEVESNLALTLSQQLHSLTNLSEREKATIVKEKDEEINKLTENCRELNEVITNLQEQTANYPELLEKHEDLGQQLSDEKERCETLTKHIELLKKKEEYKDCDRLRSRVRELENELVALRKLEEDNILLASENEKLIEQLEVEKQKLDLMAGSSLPDSESKLKLEELHNEKSPSKLKENSKKYLKKRVSQLENDCKDLWRKLQSEVLKGKQQELEINREVTEKEKILQELHKVQISRTHERGTRKSKSSKAGVDSNVSLNNSNNEEETGSINEDKDNDYFILKEELKKSQNRTLLLQTEIDRLRESYSNNLSKELEEMENKWTQRLRRECNSVHSEMAEEFRKQKEAWRKKESELHCVIKELQIQIEETETERKRLERELNALKGKDENGKKNHKHLVEAKSGENSDQSNNNNTPPVEKEESQIQEYISDRDLRRLAYKLKKDQWIRLAKLLSLSEADIREIDKLKVGKDEKAFRVLSEWRTCAEEASSNQVSQLALALEEIRRKDLAQFVMEHCMAGKCRNKLIGV